MNIRDRVIELRRIPANELRKNPRNWRKHPTAQQKALRKVLEKIGFAGAALAYDDHEYGITLIDGHIRQDQVGSMAIPVLMTDLDRQEANALLALYDPLAAMAEQDNALLKGLIAELPEMDLEDVGLSVAALLGVAENDFDPRDEWVGMPEFDQEAVKKFHSLTLHFKTEQDMIAFSRLIGQTVNKTTQYLYYPKLEHDHENDFRVVSDES